MEKQLDLSYQSSLFHEFDLLSEWINEGQHEWSHEMFAFTKLRDGSRKQTLNSNFASKIDR